MQKFRGRLLYTGWFNLPWKMTAEKTQNSQSDLWPIVEKFFISLNGKRADHKRTHDGYTLFADESSDLQFEYVPGECAVLNITKSVGISNVYAYLNDFLYWLSGRLVEVEVEDGEQMKFYADTSEKVFGVYFVGEGNSCEVPSGAEKSVCKAGQRNCCVFLSWRWQPGFEGFQCEKFSGPLARTLLDRLAKGTIRARRIGNCAVLGRKESELVAT